MMPRCRCRAGTRLSSGRWSFSSWRDAPVAYSFRALLDRSIGPPVLVRRSRRRFAGMRSDQDGDHAQVVRVDVDADVTGARQLARQAAGQSIRAGDRAPNVSDRSLFKLSECLSDRDDLLTLMASTRHAKLYVPGQIEPFGTSTS